LCRLGENTLTQSRPIELAISKQHGITKAINNFSQGWPPQLDNPTRRMVGINGFNT
jgi:hypothetical protein